MLKQKLKNQTVSSFRGFSALFVATVLSFSIFIVPMARADQFDEQINQLKQQNNAARGQVSALQVQAGDLQGVIQKLRDEINALQGQITANQAKSDDLQQKIKDAEVELARQKDLLGQTIKAMYLEGQISTVEMLATSNDLSQFVDKQQYREVVESKIKDQLDKITILRLELKRQKELLEKLIIDQKAMYEQVAANQAEQNHLLGLNQGQQAALNGQIKANNAQVADLRAQQAAANRRLGGNVEAGDPGHGGYPGNWDRAPQDSMLDSWGMYNRECVSYTAWKVYQAYGHMPYWGGHGNANQWPASAQADGINTGSTPKAESVAISMAGYYGHAMWVEYVLPNGYIHVSQYNYDLAGHYSEMTINGAGLTYIYFN